MADTFFAEQIRIWEQELEMYSRRNKLWMKHNKDQNKHKTEIETILLLTYHFLQMEPFQRRLRQNIMNDALLYLDQIDSLQDLKKLNIAQLISIGNRQIAFLKALSILHGALFGKRPILIGTISVPFQTLLHLHAVQRIGLSFGYELNNPKEMMIALKVYISSLLPKTNQWEAWNELKELVNNPYTFSEEITLFQDVPSTYPLTYLRSIILLTFVPNDKNKRTLLSGVYHYRLFRKICHFTFTFYKYRFLTEKKSLH